MPETPAPADLDARIEAVRVFNRFWTTRIGALDATHLGTPFSLAEARTLFELAQRDATLVVDLRARLDLDAGYLSRVLADFRARKLAVTEVSAEDARRQVARLTAKGRRAAAELNAKAVDHVRDLLRPMEEQQQARLTGALEAVQALLSGRASTGQTFALRPPRAGDLGWVVERHGALYAAEYGWDHRFEGLVASVVAQYAAARDARSAAWIAEVNGERAGCVFSMQKDAHTAQLRLLLVDPRFRGHGLGHRLVDECVRFAAASGYRRMTLWTNDVLTDARRIYERAGFELVASEKHASFGPELTGQTWEKALPTRA
jgi:DNA-binding MarR family transcriptional regulator/GNAT superfamily N-acetyltransferase